MFAQTVIGNVVEVDFRDVKAVTYIAWYVINQNLLVDKVEMSFIILI